MAIILRSRREIDLMARAGAVVADVLWKLHELAKPGVSTGYLDRIASETTARAGAEALFRGVKSPYAKKAFPGAVCASINDQVVHGIPDEKVILKDGDILSIDFGVRLDGFCGDSAVTVGIGNISAANKRLIDATRRVLDIAVENCRAGIKWSEVAGLMQSFAESAGFSVVKDFVGHGIGRQMHEDPKVPNFVSKELLADDILLREGMVLAIEPMINAGTDDTWTLKDGWTVVTKDGKNSAHFEHTVAITKGGCEVLTAK
ncbi:MAG: type I methionyl aminopeptidase [Phycisphaerae bacterium]|nr:type I methionyl aminopeptidase [Phycisphaerae bacterium]